METRKFSDNLRVTEMDSCLVFTELLGRQFLRFKTSAIDLTHSERMSTSTSPFLAHRLAYSSHVSMMMLKLLCHENKTGSLYFGPLRKTSFSFWCQELSRLDMKNAPSSDFLVYPPMRTPGGREYVFRIPSVS